MPNAFMKEVHLYNGEKVSCAINRYPVDPEKFKAILKRKGLRASDVSAEIGFARNSIAAAVHSGLFSGPMVAGIKNVYGVEYSEYAYNPEEKKPEPQPEPEQKEEKSVCADETALYLTMKLAMKDAMTEWFADNVKNLRGTIYAAIMNTKK